MTTGCVDNIKVTWQVGEGERSRVKYFRHYSDVEKFIAGFRNWKNPNGLEVARVLIERLAET